jgi:uncharacterized protein YecT (DUF1311 family)
MGIFDRSLLVALLIAAGPAIAAQAPLPDDSNAVDTCLSSAKEELPTHCIGIVADPCIKAVKDDDTSASKTDACAARELAVWNAKLAAAITSVKAGGFPGAMKAVLLAQKSWLTSREALCPAFAKIDPGMFIGGANYCRLHETGNRTLLLLKLGGALKEH